MNNPASNRECAYTYQHGLYLQGNQARDKCPLPAANGDYCFFHREQPQPKTTEEYNDWRLVVGEPEKSSWFAPEAQLRQAQLQGARLEHAILTRVDICGANLTGAFLHGATLNHVNYKEHFDRQTIFAEIDTSQINWSHNPLLKRWIEDYQYLNQFRRLHRNWYYLWLLTSDCGRSWLRWLVFVLLVVVIFGFIYTPGSLIKMPDEPNWFIPFYFSVVTFSTLGFGDIYPLNLAGRVAVVLEVFCGYIMFGVLLTLITNKVARRA